MTTSPGRRTALITILACLAVAASLPAALDAQDSTTTPEGAVARLTEDLRTAGDLVQDVEANLIAAAPAERVLFEFQRRQRWQERHDILLRLAREIDRDTAVADSTTLALAQATLYEELDTGTVWLGRLRGDALTALDGLTTMPPDELVEGEIALSRLNADIDALIRALSENYQIAPALGVEVTDQAAAHDSTLVDRAEFLSASLAYAQEQAEAYRGWLDKPGVDTVTTRLRIAAAEERIAGATASLQTTVDLLDERGFPSGSYRRLIVTSSGEIGTDVLDTEILGGLLSDWTRAATDWLRANVGSIAVKLALILLVVLLAGRLAAVMRGAMKRAVGRVHMSHLIKNLIVSGASKVVWLFAFLVVLSIIGVDLGPMLAGLGIVGFVVGFALQETLANFASGLMIMIYRPFDVGDFVTTGGVTGTVKDLTLVSTVIQTLDNQRIIVPNGKVWGDVINNATAETVRRVDLVFGIAYSDDVDHARSVLEAILEEHEKVLDEPEPMVRVGELADSSVNLLCRPWCRTDDYWELKWELTRLVKKRFDAEGISIPFPQRDVHLYGNASES